MSRVGRRVDTIRDVRADVSGARVFKKTVCGTTFNFCNSTSPMTLRTSASSSGRSREEKLQNASSCYVS